MAPKTRTIYQNLIDDDHPPIVLDDEILESKLTKELFDSFFEGSPTPRRVGLAPIYSESGSLCRLALAVPKKAIIIQFHAKGKGANAYKGRGVLSSEVLCNPEVLLLAFDFHKLAIALSNDQNVRVLNGIDVQSACGAGRNPLAAIKLAAGDNVSIMEPNVQATFDGQTIDPKRTIAFALQAWVAQCLMDYPSMQDQFQAAQRINTQAKSEAELRVFAQLERGENRLALNAPTITAHEYSAVGTRRDTAHVRADRFQTRFMKSDRKQRITLLDHNTGLTFVADANVEKIDGRQTELKAQINLDGRVITSIETRGRDGPTMADQAREAAMLRALQGKDNLFANPFLQYIFKPSDDFTWPETFPTSDTIPDIVSARPLNDSQRQAVEALLSNTDQTHITIIQGPPGTGKTTVIAAYVTSAVSAGVTGIWLVAQSNIAVKNIAEKLADVGFYNWRLLVSKDFHIGWHEHLYGKLLKNIISSNEFKWGARKAQGVPVILCTISMLSNPLMHIFTSLNPIKTMVVDEASQITLGNYVSPLQNFPSIHKLCMIGDDKQLPPYGSEDEENMKSIFEIEHLRSTVLFLNTQYRMPPLIGDVVSEVVYDSQLQSNPLHPVPYETPSCWFVHVDDSAEKKHETSLHNPAERATVLKIAEKLQMEGKDYCIITPYDAQRNFLEQDMKDSGLVWQDKCFNVDSFQGNEKDFVIVSLVRSHGLGFLADYRRTNVMLTRCKRGMYIVTSWKFVWERAANTLVGRMAAKWGNEVWVNPEHLEVEA